MAKGMLIDTTRCIGCRSCQVACKNWNSLESVPGVFSDTWSSPLHMSSKTFTRVLFCEVAGSDGGAQLHFVKRQCMHCNDPACASVCPVGAMTKTKEGPVTYDDSKCMGCRYCLMACPFQVPKFQWESAVPYVRKCTFCADRQAAGLAPACASTCPMGALAFGEREELVSAAWKRIKDHPHRYVPHVYGEKTVGGASMMYLSSVTFDQIGLQMKGLRTDLGDTPLSINGREWVSKMPFIALAMGGASLGLYHYNQRRARVQAHEEDNNDGK